MLQLQTHVNVAGEDCIVKQCDVASEHALGSLSVVRVGPSGNYVSVVIPP